MKLGPLGVEVGTPGAGGWASLEILRRRKYLCMVRLPRGRVLVCSWMDL